MSLVIVVDFLLGPNVSDQAWTLDPGPWTGLAAFKLAFARAAGTKSYFSLVK